MNITSYSCNAASLYTSLLLLQKGLSGIPKTECAHALKTRSYGIIGACAPKHNTQKRMCACAPKDNTRKCMSLQTTTITPHVSRVRRVTSSVCYRIKSRLYCRASYLLFFLCYYSQLCPLAAQTQTLPRTRLANRSNRAKTRARTNHQANVPMSAALDVLEMSPL
jgi:hypothetical protein